MSLSPSVVTAGFVVAAILFACAGCKSNEKKVEKEPEVSLTITKVRAYEYFSTELEGEFKDQEVKNILVACDVVLDNQTGEDLTVQSNFSSAMDYFDLQLLRDNKAVAVVSYIEHQSPSSPGGKLFVLKQGENETELRFPMRVSPEDWADLEVRLKGSLPGSKFKGALQSNKLPIQRVDDFD